MTTEKEFLKLKSELERDAIESFEDLILIAKEKGCPASNLIICSFYGIISNMKSFINKEQDQTFLRIITALQNGMYQMANNLNNQIEEYKSTMEHDK